MNFNSVCLISTDVQRLREFYGEALEVQMQGDAAFSYVEFGGLALSMYHEAGMYQMAPDGFRGAGLDRITLEFVVDDVDAHYERLKALGAPIVKPPTTQPWGIRSVWFRDPDGNVVNFCAPVSGGPPRPAGDLARDYFQRVLNERDLSACDDLLASDYVDHDAPKNAQPGPQGIKDFMAQFLVDYPDLRVEIEDVVSEKHKAALRLVWRGCHRESGAEYHREGMAFLRSDESGKLAERWSMYETPAND